MLNDKSVTAFLVARGSLIQKWLSRFYLIILGSQWISFILFLYETIPYIPIKFQSILIPIWDPQQIQLYLNSYKWPVILFPTNFIIFESRLSVLITQAASHSVRKRWRLKVPCQTSRTIWVDYKYLKNYLPYMPHIGYSGCIRVFLAC